MRYGVPARSTSRGAKGCRSSMMTSVCERVRHTALTFHYHAEKPGVCSSILPCLASTPARCNNPLSEALNPCQDATRKMALFHFDLITLNKNAGVLLCETRDGARIFTPTTHSSARVHHGCGIPRVFCSGLEGFLLRFSMLDNSCSAELSQDQTLQRQTTSATSSQGFCCMAGCCVSLRPYSASVTMPFQCPIRCTARVETPTRRSIAARCRVVVCAVRVVQYASQSARGQGRCHVDRAVGHVACSSGRAGQCSCSRLYHAWSIRPGPDTAALQRSD